MPTTFFLSLTCQYYTAKVLQKYYKQDNVDLILVPDHCLFIYFTRYLTRLIMLSVYIPMTSWVKGHCQRVKGNWPMTLDPLSLTPDPLAMTLDPLHQGHGSGIKSQWSWFKDHSSGVNGNMSGAKGRWSGFTVAGQRSRVSGHRSGSLVRIKGHWNPIRDPWLLSRANWSQTPYP